MSKRLVNTATGAILSVTFVAAVVILALNNADGNSTTIVTLMGLVSVLVMQAIANNKSADASDKVSKVDQELTNGLIPDKVKEALRCPEGQKIIRKAVHNTKE